MAVRVGGGSERRGSRGRWSSSETTRGAGLDPQLSPSPRNGGKPKQPQQSGFDCIIYETNGDFEFDRLNSQNSALCELRWYIRQVYAYTGAVSSRRHAERKMASVGSPRACDASFAVEGPSWFSAWLAQLSRGVRVMALLWSIGVFCPLCRRHRPSK